MNLRSQKRLNSLSETVSDKLSQVIHLKAQEGATRIGWDDLNKYLANAGAEQYNRESFVVAYNSDQRLQNLVNSFDEAGLVLAGGEEPQAEPEDKTVDNMAGRATANAMK